MSTPTNRDSAAAQRVLQSLVNYIEKKGFDEGSWPHDDPVLRQRTVGQIYEAFEIIKSKHSFDSPIQKYYAKLMGDDPAYCLTPGIRQFDEEWQPFEKLRWKPLRSDWVMHGQTMLIYTPIDVFSVMSCQVEMQRTKRIFYGIQSLLAKEKARYYLANNPNPRARRQIWHLRKLGDHEIAKGLPIILGTTASFSARNRRAFEELNPLPPLQPIEPEQSEFHDFVVQSVIAHNRVGMDYGGRQWTEAAADAPTVQPTRRQTAVRQNTNDALVERARRLRAEEDQALREAIPDIPVTPVQPDRRGRPPEAQLDPTAEENPADIQARILADLAGIAVDDLQNP